LKPPTPNCFLFLLTLLALAGSVQSQSITRTNEAFEPRVECRIDKISIQTRSLEVQCEVKNLRAGAVALRFKERSAGVAGLDERLYSFKASDERGATISPELPGGGVYRIEQRGEFRFRYEMRLARAYRADQHALVSSLGPEAGVLMPGDLLPEVCDPQAQQMRCSARARIQVAPPSGWTIATTAAKAGEAFEFEDASLAVLFLGRLREARQQIQGMSIRTAIAGKWKFRDQDIFPLVESIAREQAAMIGSRESGEFLVTLASYPQGVSGLRSSALTRGRTVVLMLNENEDPAATIAHFRKHLAHEMFHFYLPNAFQIRENIDWFWEGFTRYIALLTLVRLRLVGFDEYLREISAEYEAYFYNPLRLRRSLLDASPDKLTGAEASSLVYRKGMLVAALYDLELRRQTRGQESLPSALQAFYREFALTRRAIGNQEALDFLGRTKGLAKILRDDVESVKEIDLGKRIKSFGLVSEQTAGGHWRIRSSDDTRLPGFFVQMVEGR
jgi:predicted metalloprotease with PDZ domain